MSAHAGQEESGGGTRVNSIFGTISNFNFRTHFDGSLQFSQHILYTVWGS